MKRLTLTIVGTALMLAGSAFAHSPVKTTSPADKAVLSAEPEMLHLTFAAPARVMKVTMMHEAAGDSSEVRIKIPTRDMVNEIHLTPDFMGAGNYTVNWRALGEDGHVLNGEFSFEITGE